MKKTLKTILVVAIILIVVIALIIVEIRLYGTGFAGKTLWDWLQLLAALAIPVVVGFGAIWFTMRQGKVASAENTDNQRETALQAYINKMSELLLEKNLRDSAEEDEVRKIARVWTLTVLLQLDGERKTSVLNFLSEADLIKKNKLIIDLMSANLSETDLSPIFLNGVYNIFYNLSGTILSRANLSGTNLSEANLSWANLSRADLSRADLSRANLSGANLSGALQPHFFEAMLR